MAASAMASLALKPSPFPLLDQSRFQGVQPSARSSTFRVMAKKTKKIQTSQPFGFMAKKTKKIQTSQPFGFMAKKTKKIQPSQPFGFMAKETKKIQTSQPFGPAGGLNLKDGVDASGRPAKGKGVYQFAKKYGGNVDGYSPIYNPEEWSPSGDIYAGGKTGLLLWAVTFAGILLAGALLIYNTSALSK